ncbi:MAG: SDR family oxidoreductase, partial [Prolixibacteraceae bacterium]|nr:SDR family oxidoreductase [Prolixibacteraceae bacterium]
DQGYRVICCVRDKKRFSYPAGISERIEILEIDFLSLPPFEILPTDFDAAYYLIHSMSASTDKFFDLESKAASNFVRYMDYVRVKQVIYLGGIVNAQHLSKHLSSRKNVETILAEGNFRLTVLRAGIVVGSGSASFEIIRDIVEKLPLIISPSWVNTKSQPIAIRDVISYLVRVLYNDKCYNKSFDIGGPEVLTYKEMLAQYAHLRKLKRTIISLPFFSPKLSSYWLFVITSVSYKLARNLVDSMKMEIVCKEQELEKILKVNPITYSDAIKYAFAKIAQNTVISSWKDSLASSILGYKLSEIIEVPQFGCYKNIKKIKITDSEKVLHNIWSIGGAKGYYYANWLWKIRGFFDQIVGGVGLNRGRTLPQEIHTGDALDFWRVLYANKKEKRILLFAEMKLPGEAWLEFKIDNNNVLHQIATFRPKGVWGRLYWICTSPAHFFIFNGMIRNIALT